MKLVTRNLIVIAAFMSIAAFASVSADAALIPQLEWIRTYDSPAHDSDGGADVVIDAAGNVYVTGSAAADVWLRKYKANGDVLWTQTYDSPAHSADHGFGVALDAAGDYVYVTGKSHRPDQSQDYNIWLNKYDSNDGNPIWPEPVSYDTPLPVSDSGEDGVVDGNGYIYVAGVSGWLEPSAGDIWFGKFAPDGTLLWEKTYDNPNAESGYGITLDAAGNLYVTGEVNRSDQGQSWDVWLNKYDSDGNPLWDTPVTWNGSANAMDRGIKVATDAAGNVYVTGYENRQDHEGQDANIWINKYDAEGNALWDTPIIYDSPAHGGDWGNSVTVDAAGNIYVTGREYRSDLGQDYNIWLRKYDTNGNVLWAETYNNPAHTGDHGGGVAVDAAGNVYVTGTSNNDIILLKYSQTEGVIPEPSTLLLLAPGLLGIAGVLRGKFWNR